MALSSGIVCMEGTVETCYDFIMPDRGYDHAPTAARIHIPFSGKDMLIRRRVPEYDRKATKDSEKVKVFKCLLREIPRPFLSEGSIRHRMELSRW